jgi:hypothetical protein
MVESTMVLIGDSREDIVLKVVQHVADREDVSPLDLPPLSTAIDPERITSLPEQATLEFPYYGYMVTIQGTRTVQLRTLTDEESMHSA